MWCAGHLHVLKPQLKHEVQHTHTHTATVQYELWTQFAFQRTIIFSKPGARKINISSTDWFMSSDTVLLFQYFTSRSCRLILLPWHVRASFFNLTTTFSSMQMLLSLSLLHSKHPHTHSTALHTLTLYLALPSLCNFCCKSLTTSAEGSSVHLPLCMDYTRCRCCALLKCPWASCRLSGAAAACSQQHCINEREILKGLMCLFTTT